ncbi:MAG: hypothetical protein ACOX69_11620 [Coriobacteriales bacterium]|jgi:hypothetical protein
MKTALRFLTNRNVYTLCAVLMGAFLTLLVVLLVPAGASAVSSNISVKSVSFGGESSDSVSTQPHYESWDIAIDTDGYLRNTGGSKDSLALSNAAKVSLTYADGTPVEGYSVRIGSGEGERGVIYIELEQSLDPLTEYKITISDDLTEKLTHRTLGEDYTTSFTTDAECDNGLTVYQNALIVVTAVMLVVGVVVMVRRRKRGLR